LRVFITTLRKKLERDPTRPKRIMTEPGVGYRLVVDALGEDSASDIRSSD
jgi:two-component system KDP operon response regulator KdpE